MLIPPLLVMHITPLPTEEGLGVGLLNDYDYGFRITAIKLTE